MLGILLIGCFALEPLGIPISAISAVCAVLLLVIAAKGHKISTRKVLKEAPWQIVIFSLGMYLVVYGLRNAGLTGLPRHLARHLRRVRRVGRGHGHRRADGLAVVGHEQPAHSADRRVVH